MAQKALFLESKLGEFALRTHEIPEPTAGHILVKIEAAGLNPVDWKIPAWGLFVEDYPAIFEFDAAGTVRGVGEGVEGWSVGDRVLLQGSFGNALANFQQFCLVPARLAAKLPDRMSFDQAASLPTAIVTATVGLYSTEGGPRLTPPWKGGRGKYAGTPILVIGGASAVGSLAIQFARLSGFSPILATASLKNEALVRAYGATHVLDRGLSADALATRVAELVGAGLPVRHVFDAIALPETERAGLAVLKGAGAGGALVVVNDVAVDVEEAAEAGVTVGRTIGVVQLPFNVAFGEELFPALGPLLEEGAIEPLRVEVVQGGLCGIVGALERLKNDQVSGTKLVVRPHETP